MVLRTTAFWDQVAVNAVGPLVTAIVGLLIAGLAINRYTRALQDRRIDNELKYGLISEITDTASTLYHHILMYDRARAGAGDAEDSQPVDTEELRELRKKVLEQYPASRARADTLEEWLTAYFADSHVALAWHAARDCLSVRYHNAVRRKNWEQTCRANSKGWDNGYHTGLSAEELTNTRKVSNAYHLHLKTTARLIFACPLRQQRASRRAKRNIDLVLKQAQDMGFDYDSGQTAV